MTVFSMSFDMCFGDLGDELRLGDLEAEVWWKFQDAAPKVLEELTCNVIRCYDRKPRNANHGRKEDVVHVTVPKRDISSQRCRIKIDTYLSPR